MVFTAKKKSKIGLQILPKNNPYLSLRTEKKGGHCTSPLTKNSRIFIHSFSILWEPFGETLLEKICRHILTVTQPFCVYVCRGFSEMFRGLFHKQGVGGFTPERAEVENRSLKPNVVVCDRAEAKPPDGRPHWGTASPPSTSCKIPR